MTREEIQAVVGRVRRQQAERKQVEGKLFFRAYCLVFSLPCGWTEERKEALAYGIYKCYLRRHDRLVAQGLPDPALERPLNVDRDYIRGGNPENAGQFSKDPGGGKGESGGKAGNGQKGLTPKDTPDKMKAGATEGERAKAPDHREVTAEKLAERKNRLNEYPDRDSEVHDEERQKLLDDLLSMGNTPQSKDLGEIAADLEKTGGFTYDVNSGTVKPVGFSVAIEGHEKPVRVKGMTSEQIKNELRQYSKEKLNCLNRTATIWAAG
jgi:hypothetical protein